MSQEPLCEACRKRLQRGKPKESFFGRIRRRAVVRLERFRQAVSASAEFEAELQLVSVASLLAGAATVYMIYVVTCILPL